MKDDYDDMFMLALLFVLLLCFAGCAKEEPTPIEIEDERRSEIQERYDAGLAVANSWDNGIPSPTDCDGLVFASLACAAGATTDIDLFQYSPGEWHRRPFKACYDKKDQGSKTSISNDGLVALLLCLSVRKDLDNADALRDYGMAHNWVMGTPTDRIAEVIFKPHFVGILYRLLGDDAPGSKIPLILKHEDRPEYDYVPHIQSLAILADAINTGKTSSGNVKLINRYADSDPKDALIGAISGMYTGRNSVLPPTVPSYVRGDQPERFALVHQLLADRITLYGIK